MQFLLIIKDLLREKTRVILTIVAIVWGTFSVSSMLAIGEGLRLTFAKTTASAGTNFLSLSGGTTSKMYFGSHPDNKIYLNQMDLEAIKKLPNVANVSSEYEMQTTMSYKLLRIDSSIKAVDPSYFSIHQIQVQEGGRLVNAVDIIKENAVIVLGNKTQEELFGNELNSIGEIVLIGKQPFTVIGVMQKKPEFMSSEAPDEYLNWIPVSTYQLLANPRYIDRISITYKNLNLLTGTKQQIQQIIALHHNADPDDSSIVNFTDLAKIQNTINTFFYGMQIFLGIIGSLTLLIAGVGIANVMFASIKRATHEIGVQMALGARTYHILFHYIAESFLVTIIGGSIGLVLSFLLVFGVRKITFQGKLIEVIGQPNPVLSLKVIFIVVVILGLTGFLAGLFPAMKAAKVDPAESLTYE